MILETRLRFAAGITMAVLVIGIILSGVNELNLLLLTCIQVKVFHVRMDYYNHMAAKLKFNICTCRKCVK